MTILAWLAVSSLVWGAVIWGAGRLIQGSGDVSGRARQWIWRGATVLLIAPWVATPLVMAFGWGLAPTEVTPVVPAATLATLPVDEFTGEMLLDFTGAPAPAAIALDLTQMLLLVLAGGWIVRFVLAQYAAKSLLGIVAVSRPAEKGAATVALAAWTKRLGLRRAPRLRIVNEAVSPFSFGVFRPVICLPEGLEHELSREALDLVIGHECLHVARGDGWRRPLERITADVFWFNPAAWLIRRELDVARELACDEGVVELSAARTAYARTLRDVAGFSAGLSHAAPAASMSLAGGRSLMLRVKRTLASAKRKPARAAVVAAVLIGLVGAPIAVAQVVFVVPAPPAPPAPPQAPESPAAADIDSDGSVRATFAGKITTITGGKQNGFNVRLEGESEGAPCVADLNGLVSIDVAKGDAVKEGSLIGKRESGRSLRVSVTCTGGQQHGFVAPPAPPPAAPTVELAELAAPPSAPAPLAAPAPKAAPSAVPAPPPPAPPAPMGQVSPLSPAPPVPMAPPAASLSPVAPVAPIAPPSPQGISYTITNAPYAVIPDGARTSSEFGVRVDPFSNKTVFHNGVDLAAPRGVTVHAPGNAMVLRAEKTGGAAGNVVELRTPENYVVRLAQLDEIKVQAGEQVGAGAVVGTVGSSGVSTGPHLHMEVLVDGKPVDPAQVQGLKLTAG